MLPSPPKVRYSNLHMRDLGFTVWPYDNIEVTALLSSHAVHTRSDITLEWPRGHIEKLKTPYSKWYCIVGETTSTDPTLQLYQYGGPIALIGTNIVTKNNIQTS